MVIEKLTKNVFSLSFGQAASFLTNVAAIVLAARFLGVENFGVFSSVLAIVSILSKLVDFGIEPIVFREFSKNKENYNLLNSAITLRFSIYLILLVVYNIAAFILAFDSTEIIFVNILFLTIILSAKMMVIREILATPFKVNFKMHYPMVLSVLDNIVLFVLILFIPFVQNKILYFIIAYTVSNLPGFILSFYYLYKKFNYKYKVAYENFSWIIKESLPLFGFVILSNIFQQIDIVILSSLKGNYDVGIYSAGVRLTMPLNIIPGAIVTSVFPILVKKMTDKESTEFITNLVIKLLFFISFVIASVFSFGSAEIVRIVFGREYASSAFSASILYWCQIFIFFTYYSLSVLIANNKQNYNFIFGLIQVLINLVFILLLVPDYSFVGASIAKLIASFVGFVYIIYVLSKLGMKPSIGRYKMLLWSGMIALTLWLLSDMPLVVYLTLSAIVIFILTIGLKFFEKDEIIAFFKLVNKEEVAKKLFARFKFLS